VLGIVEDYSSLSTRSPTRQFACDSIIDICPLSQKLPGEYSNVPPFLFQTRLRNRNPVRCSRFACGLAVLRFDGGA